MKKRPSSTFKKAGLWKSELTDKPDDPSGRLLPAAWRAVRGGGRFPWRPTPLDLTRRWLLSAEFRLALQVVSALILSSLFVLVRPMKFTGSELASVLLVMGLVNLPQHPNLGCRLNAIALLIFTAVLGPLINGIVASIAQSCGAGRLSLLIIFSLAALIPMTAVRVMPGPPGTSLMPCLALGFGIIGIDTGQPYARLWQQAALNVCLAYLIAAAAMFLSVTLVLPTLAGDELNERLAATLQGLGHQLSAFASVILADNEDPLAALHSQLSQGTSLPLSMNASFSNMDKSMALPEEKRNIIAFLAAIRSRTNPENVFEPSVALPPHPTTKKLRAAATLCKALAAEAELEPAWLSADSAANRHRSELVYAVRALLTRINALQLLIEGGQLLESAWLDQMCLFDPLPGLRRVFANLASSCMALSRAVRAGSLEPGAFGHLGWHELRMELATCIKSLTSGYWQRFLQDYQQQETEATVPTALEVRVVMFLASLANGIIDALQDVERKLQPGFHQPELHDPGEAVCLNSPTTAKDSAAGTSAVGNANLSNGMKRAEGSNAGAISKPAQLTKRSAERKETRICIDRPEIEKSGKDNNGQAAKRPHPGQRERDFRFAARFAAAALGEDFWTRLKAAMWTNAVVAGSSRKELLKALQSRRLRFAVRYWLGSSAILALTLGLNNAFPATISWRLEYAYVTSLVILLAHVEAVVWKFLQRVLGTLIGGSVAFLILLIPGTSGRPVILMAASAAFIFAILHAVTTPLRYTVYLSANTCVATILATCIYECTTEADFRLWLTRVLGIIGGCTIAMAITWLILPTYASDAHLELLADAFEAAAELFGRFYDAFHSSCQAKASAPKPAAGDADQEASEDGGVGAAAKLMRDLEDQVVMPVESVLLGLSQDAVIWRRGPLSSPPIVNRLTLELRFLVRRLAALQLATKQGLEELGEHTQYIHEYFFDPMYREYKELAASAGALAAAAAPILRHGWSEARVSEVEAALEDMQRCRVMVYQHYYRLRHGHHRTSVNLGHTLSSAQDSLLISTWMIAGGKVLDQMMLVARIAIAEGSKARETRFTSLGSFSWNSETRATEASNTSGQGAIPATPKRAS